jgi:hypothetical protein
MGSKDALRTLEGALKRSYDALMNCKKKHRRTVNTSMRPSPWLRTIVQHAAYERAGKER